MKRLKMLHTNERDECISFLPIYARIKWWKYEKSELKASEAFWLLDTFPSDIAMCKRKLKWFVGAKKLEIASSPKCGDADSVIFNIMNHYQGLRDIQMPMLRVQIHHYWLGCCASESTSFLAVLCMSFLGNCQFLLSAQPCGCQSGVLSVNHHWKEWNKMKCRQRLAALGQQWERGLGIGACCLLLAAFCFCWAFMKWQKALEVRRTRMRLASARSDLG